MNRCKQCGKEIPEGRKFCSNHCSAVYNNTHRVKKVKKIRLRELKPCRCCGTLTVNWKYCSERCKSLSFQIPTLKRYFGFDDRVLGTETVWREYNRVRQMLYEDYWKRGMSSLEIAEKYNYPSGHNLSGKVFVYLEIPRRTREDAMRNAVFRGTVKPGQGAVTKHGFYSKAGWHTSWQGLRVYLRSSLEFKFAKTLDEKRISYTVESIRVRYSFEGKERVAIPDFYLPETNEIVEVKGMYTYDKSSMEARFEAYRKLGYSPILVLENERIVGELPENVEKHVKY